MRISDWSSDVCSSDLLRIGLVAAELQAGGDVQRELMPAMRHHVAAGEAMVAEQGEGAQVFHQTVAERAVELQPVAVRPHAAMAQQVARVLVREQILAGRTEEHTSELQSLMRISYAVFCSKKKNTLLP